LRTAGQVDPDLVIMDAMLPGVDGFAVTQQLRRAGRQMPVVFLTARDSAHDKITGLTVGGDDYLSGAMARHTQVSQTTIAAAATFIASRTRTHRSGTEAASLALTSSDDHPASGRCRSMSGLVAGASLGHCLRRIGPTVTSAGILSGRPSGKVRPLYSALLECRYAL